MVMVGLLLTACWRETPAPREDPVIVSARWLTPESLEVQIRTTQDVCLADQLLGRDVPGFRQAIGPYRRLDRAHQWTDPDTCEFVISLSHQDQLGVTDVQFALPSAVRCVPAGAKVTHTVRLPQPWTYWHPDEFTDRPLSYVPRAVRVDVGWTYTPPVQVAVSLTTGETMQLPEVRWMDTTIPPYLREQQLASARLPLPDRVELFRSPESEAPHPCVDTTGPPLRGPR